MNAIWQKIKADLFHHRIVSFLIICTITVAATLLTLAISTLMNLGAPYDRVFEQVNGAHLWLYFKPELVNESYIRRIEALPGVETSTGLQYGYVTQARIHDTQVAVTLRVAPLKQPDVHRLYFLEGRNSLPRVKEVVAEKFLDTTYKLAVGERVIITGSDGMDISLPVVGLAYDAMYDTYRIDQAPYLYVSEDTLRTLFPDKDTWSWSLGLRLSDPERVADVLAEIEALNSLKFVKSHTDWPSACLPFWQPF
jgi:putative ABC transport system permease protein